MVSWEEAIREYDRREEENVRDKEEKEGEQAYPIYEHPQNSMTDSE